MEPLDQGEKTEFVHFPERIRPPKFIFSPNVWSDECVVKMGSCGDVPGATSEAACQKTVLVVHYMGDDRFDNLLGKIDRRG